MEKDGDMDNKQKEMKKGLKEREDEDAARGSLQGKVEKRTRKAADLRSVFVGNVDYSCTREQVKRHFQSCGTVNRVTILVDMFGQPKGFSYVEFLEVEAVEKAVSLNGSQLHGRPLKVAAKRTNVPGLNSTQHRAFGRQFNPYMLYYPFMPPYQYVPRFRQPMRYRPY